MSAVTELIAGRYRLERRIAAGGMGVVWLARDELLQRAVAVKQLRTQAGASEEDAELAKNRAMREARITARLHHPNAVPVFDSVEHDGEPCLVMQYVPSVTLGTLLKERGALPGPEVARIGGQVAGALAAAHAVGIVHRDVKPGNILIADADGSALISDFGISHALGDSTLTSTGLVHGTPAYLAPEVARGGDSTFASDVFSLGSTLYAASEGQAPFGEGANSIAVLHRVAVGGFAAPQRSGPLGALLMRMMADDPEARPTMQEVARALDALPSEGVGRTLPLPLDPSDAAPGTTGTEEDGWDEDPTQAAALDATAVQTAVQPVVEDDDGADDDEVDDSEVDDAEDEGAEHEGAGASPADDAADRTMPSPTLLAPLRPAAAEPAAAPPAPVEPAAAPAAAEDPRRRRRAPLLVGALVVVALLAVVLVAVLRGLAPAPQSRADPAQSPAKTPASIAPVAKPTPTSTPKPTPTSTPAPSPSPTRPSPAPTSTPSPTASASAATGAPTASQLASALTSYYALLPGDTDDAWPRMTADYQSGTAEGRSKYESFWDDVRSVSLSDVEATAPDAVSATVTLRFTDGSTEVDHTDYRLVREDGILKIADSANE